MTYLRVFGAIFVLLAVFLFGMWLTWREFPGSPTGFPINRTFVAVSLNGVPFNPERTAQMPTFEVRRTPLLRYRASGNGGCNAWRGEILLALDGSIAWRDIYVTTRTCHALHIERPYLKTLLKSTRWRTESGTLILEDDADVLHFQLAPRTCRWPWCAPRFQLARG